MSTTRMERETGLAATTGKTRTETSRRNAASTTAGAARTGMPIARLIRASSCVIACLVVGTPASLRADPVHSETGNHCVDEAKNVLQQSFGPDARITEARIMPSQGLDTLWVKSNLCKGYFVFPALGNDDYCSAPAYISAPRSAFGMMWGYGDCATLVEEAARKGDRHEAKAPDSPATSAPAKSP
jgi:hypothetical protein